MLFQLVRYQRQGWRPSLYAQVGQPAGATTDKHLLRKKEIIIQNQIEIDQIFRLWSRPLCPCMVLATPTWTSNISRLKMMRIMMRIIMIPETTLEIMAITIDPTCCRHEDNFDINVLRRSSWWSWPKNMNLYYFQRWDFASHNIYWAFLSSMQQKRVSLGGSVLSSAYWAPSSTMGSQWTVLQLTIGESQTRCNYRYFGWHEHCSEVHAETFCLKSSAQSVPAGTSGGMWALLRGCSSLQPRNKGFQNNCSADFSGLYTSLWRIN